MGWRTGQWTCGLTAEKQAPSSGTRSGSTSAPVAPTRSAFRNPTRGNQICVRGTDSPNLGWGAGIVIECKEIPSGHMEVHIGPGQTGTNYVCVLPTHCLFCDGDAGDVHKRINSDKHGDKFTIWTSHTDHVCARRADGAARWKMDLRIACRKPGPKLWDTVRVDIGASGTNEKCVPAPNERVKCDDLAANPDHRLTATEHKDSFHVEHKGNQICVRRTDSPNLGWGAGIVIECKEIPSGHMEVHIGPGYMPEHYPRDSNSPFMKSTLNKNP